MESRIRIGIGSPRSSITIPYVLKGLCHQLNIFFKTYKIQSVLFVQAHMVFKFLSYLVQETNYYEVFAVLRTRDVYPGSELFPSRIRINEFKYFSPFKLSEISSGLFIPDPDPDYLPIPDSGSRGEKGTGSRIRIRNTEFLFPSLKTLTRC
jgi:hypothetical protein